jgi:hypothetical protein
LLSSSGFASSATWLLSEIFASQGAQAQIEAAAILDAHAHELCGDASGTFSWPASIEYHWLPEAAPLPVRLRVLRAVQWDRVGELGIVERAPAPVTPGSVYSLMQNGKAPQRHRIGG